MSRQQKRFLLRKAMKKKQPFATDNELRELIDELSTPKMRGKTFEGMSNPRILLVPIDKVLYWDGKWNSSRSRDDLDKREPAIREDFSRKSNGDHNVDTRQPLPVLAKYADRPEFYLASGYGRVYTFKKNGQEYWLFLVYEIPDKKVMKLFQSFWNDNPRQNHNTIDDKVSVLVSQINDGELKVKDLNTCIEDTYKVMDPKVKGKLIDEVRTKVKTKTEPKDWEIPDAYGEVLEYAIDKQFQPRFNYLKVDEIVGDKIGKLIKGGNEYFSIKWWTMMRNYKNHSLKTEFIGYTNTPRSHRNLTKMRLSLYNEINRLWNEVTSWGIGKRKPFKFRGFYPSDRRRKNGEPQHKLVSVKQMLADAKGYGLV
jgi:hypothetical protein